MSNLMATLAGIESWIWPFFEYKRIRAKDHRVSDFVDVAMIEWKPQISLTVEHPENTAKI